MYMATNNHHNEHNDRCEQADDLDDLCTGCWDDYQRWCGDEGQLVLEVLKEI